MRENLEKVIEERRRILEHILNTAHEFAEKLREKLGKVTVILYGSYARGDFNLWSDVDLIVISETFNNVPTLRRYDMVMELTPPKFELKLWTPDEARVCLSKPWWKEALKHRIILVDDYNVLEMLE